MLGASPRASLALYHTSQALAAIQGYEHVTPDHIKRLVIPVLAHRLILSAEARLRGHSAQEVLVKLIEGVPVPVEEIWDRVLM
jgi:MoxR-like ATPase